jgi:hypothetical protein
MIQYRNSRQKFTIDAGWCTSGPERPRTIFRTLVRDIFDVSNYCVVVVGFWTPNPRKQLPPLGPPGYCITSRSRWVPNAFIDAELMLMYPSFIIFLSQEFHHYRSIFQSSLFNGLADQIDQVLAHEDQIKLDAFFAFNW